MILLVQFRTNQAGWHELKCVYEASGLTFDQFKFINAASKTTSAKYLIDSLKGVSAVIMGGTGEYGYGDKDKKKKEEFNKIREKTIPFIKQCIKRSIPILGMCFGHQLVAEALSGVVQEDLEQAEVGKTRISLTKYGEKDKLFKGIPSSFSAIEGHKDSIVIKPTNITVLATSEKCQIQAFKYRSNVYGVQFHPEMNEDDLKFRLALFPKYGSVKRSGSAKSSKVEHSKKVIRNFLNLVGKSA